jgi:hypothetical protein
MSDSGQEEKTRRAPALDVRRCETNIVDLDAGGMLALFPLGSIDQFETIEEPPNICCVGPKSLEGSQPRWIAKQTDWQN